MFSFSAEHLSEGLWQPPETWVLTPLYAPTLRPRPTVSGFRQSAQKNTGDFFPLLCPLCVEGRADTWVRVHFSHNNLRFSSERRWNGLEPRRARKWFLYGGRAWLIMVLRFRRHVALRGSVTWEKCTANAAWLHGRSSCSVWHVLKWAAPFPPDPPPPLPR